MIETLYLNLKIFSYPKYNFFFLSVMTVRLKILTKNTLSLGHEIFNDNLGYTLLMVRSKE